MIESDAIKQDRFTQVYIHADPNRQDNRVWVMLRGIRLSERFLYIEDPTKSYFGWTYCIFIYSKYTGEDS